MGFSLIVSIGTGFVSCSSLGIFLCYAFGLGAWGAFLGFLVVLSPFAALVCVFKMNLASFGGICQDHASFCRSKAYFALLC